MFIPIEAGDISLALICDVPTQLLICGGTDNGALKASGFQGSIPLLPLPSAAWPFHEGGGFHAPNLWVGMQKQRAKHLQTVCWFFHHEFRLLFQGEFCILVVSPIDAEPRKEPEMTLGSRSWRAPFRPPTCSHSRGAPCCFYTLKIKMLLRLLMLLQKHQSVSSTALPGGSEWWECHI